MVLNASPLPAAHAPGITLSPGSGYSQAKLTVHGTGFGCSEKVRVTFDGALMGKAAADGSGNFSLSFTVPKLPAAGPYPVVATGTKTGLSARSVFTADPPASIVLSPTSDQIGGLVTVTGADFQGSEIVGISFGSTQVANAAANPTGGFTQAFPVPSGVPQGNTTATATGQTSKLTATAPFRVTMPATAVILSPGDGFPDAQVAVTGTYFGCDEEVDVYFDTTELALASTNNNGGFTQNVLVPASASPGRHRVTATGRWSGLSAQAAFIVSIGDWPQFMYGPLHSGYNPFENVLSPSNVSDLGKAWSALIGNYIISSPAVADGVVYVGSYDMNLYAFNAAAGAQLWKAQTGEGIESSPAVANGMVYVGSYDHNLYAYSLAAGMSGSSPAEAAGKTAGAGPPDPADLKPDFSLELR